MKTYVVKGADIIDGISGLHKGTKFVVEGKTINELTKPTEVWR